MSPRRYLCAGRGNKFRASRGSGRHGPSLDTLVYPRGCVMGSRWTHWCPGPSPGLGRRNEQGEDRSVAEKKYSESDHEAAQGRFTV